MGIAPGRLRWRDTGPRRRACPACRNLPGAVCRACDEARAERLERHLQFFLPTPHEGDPLAPPRVLRLPVVGPRRLRGSRGGGGAYRVGWERGDARGGAALVAAGLSAQHKDARVAVLGDALEKGHKLSPRARTYFVAHAEAAKAKAEKLLSWTTDAFSRDVANATVKKMDRQIKIANAQ